MRELSWLCEANKVRGLIPHEHKLARQESERFLKSPVTKSGQSLNQSNKQRVAQSFHSRV